MAAGQQRAEPPPKRGILCGGTGQLMTGGS